MPRTIAKSLRKGGRFPFPCMMVYRLRLARVDQPDPPEHPDPPGEKKGER